MVQASTGSARALLLRDDAAAEDARTELLLQINWSWGRKMEPIRVFVVDDHPMIRHGLAAMLKAEPGMSWVGDAADGADAMRSIPVLAPDVVLMDLVMPRMDGVDCIRALRPLLPQTRFVILKSLLDPAEVRRAMDAGACGYLLKNASSQELVSVIQMAQRGHRVLAPKVTDTLVAGQRNMSPGGDLTARERELLALLARGHSNQAISTELTIAMPTVKFHVTNILAKLNADNRTAAVLVALRHKLVALE